MKLKHIIASFAAAALFLTGCTLELEPVQSLEGLAVSNDYFTLATEEGSSESITVTGDESWSIENAAGWLSVSPTSGSAGQAVSVTFKALSASTAARKAEVKIVMGAKTKIINVNQAAPKGVEIPPSTVKEIIEGPDKSYKVTGTVTKITNTHYGNWYINDGTVDGDGLYIYGTLDKKGADNSSANSWDNLNDPNYANSWSLSVGDKVTIEGPRQVYNGTVELVNVTIVKIEPSLIDASLSSPVIGPEARLDTLFVSSKVQPLLVSVDADWVKVVDFTSDGNYLLSVESNARTATRTANISIKGPGALKSVVLTQEGVPATGATVTEIIAQEDKSVVQTLPSTVVVALTTRGAILSDGTSAIYAYGNPAASLKLGDGVRMSATKTTYNGVPELTDITDVFVDSEGNAINYPDAKDITSVVGDYNASVAEYIKFSGTLSISGNYYNITFDDVDSAVRQGSIVYPVDALEAKSWDGKKITVTGYFNGISGGKFVNVVATKIQEFVDNPKGTLRNPYGATEIAQLIKGGDIPEGKVYVRGIINKIDNINTGYGNAQYWLSTDGTTADFEAYRSYYYGGEKWTEENADAIKEGDEVVLYGEVTYYAANDVAEFKQGNYLITINGKALPEGDGTAENPFNVTKLAGLLLAGETFSGEVYAKGIISQIDNVNINYGNAQYWISDDGSKLFQMEIYRGFYFDGAKFSSEDQIALGDEVVVFGKVKMYNSTPEFDANNKIISLNGKTE